MHTETCITSLHCLSHYHSLRCYNSLFPLSCWHSVVLKANSLASTAYLPYEKNPAPTGFEINLISQDSIHSSSGVLYLDENQLWIGFFVINGSYSDLFIVSFPNNFFIDLIAVDIWWFVSGLVTSCLVIAAASGEMAFPIFVGRVSCIDHL